MIEELLEQRQTLMEIASVLYGDLYIMHDKFWESTTCKEMQKVEEALLDLGYKEEVTEEQIELAKKIARALGFSDFDEEEL